MWYQLLAGGRMLVAPIAHYLRMELELDAIGLGSMHIGYRYIVSEV